VSLWVVHRPKPAMNSPPLLRTVPIHQDQKVPLIDKISGTFISNMLDPFINARLLPASPLQEKEKLRIAEQ